MMLENKIKLPLVFAKLYGVVLQKIENDHAVVLHHKQLPPEIILEIRRFVGMPAIFNQTSPDDFNQHLTKIYEVDSSITMQLAETVTDDIDLKSLIEDLPKTEDLLEKQDEAPIIRLLNALLTEAIKKNASDIHIETHEEQLIIRFRIDGILHEILKPQRLIAPLLISRIKVMAKLDIAEKRLPQDGRLSVRLGGRAIDVRVSTLPIQHGERIVLRILDKQSARFTLTHLGMSDDTLERMEDLIEKPQGIILVTGPTGSGKTTTLYAALTQLNESTRNILTVEDPIEYAIPGIGQTQVNTKVDMNFAKGFRAILRQDPDIVMVGEIRDVETAKIAIQASLTGHLVLSTLHTNNAIGAITRLRDMGIESFLLSSTIVGVIAQRLVRVLCEHCKSSQKTTAEEMHALNLKHEKNIYRSIGCAECNNTGFLGRTGIYEIIPIDETLKSLIHDNHSEQQLIQYAKKLYPDMREDGFRLVISGKTTLEEVYRVIGV